MRGAVAGDVLDLLALAPAVDETEDSVADQLEGVAIGVPGVIVTTG